MPTPKARASQKLRNMNAGSSNIGGISVGGKIVPLPRKITTVDIAATTIMPIVVTRKITHLDTVCGHRFLHLDIDIPIDF